MASVNEAEEQITELEDGMVEEKAKTETWLKKNPISRMYVTGDYGLNQRFQRKNHRYPRGVRKTRV